MNPKVTIFECGGSRKRPKCSTLNCQRTSTKKCDYPVKDGICARPLCAVCAVPKGDGIDHCQPHARAAKGTP